MTNDNPTVLFHIGLHKTGTTWLQNQIFTPQNGQHFVYSEDRKVIRGSLLVKNSQFFDAQDALREYEPLLEQAKRKNIPLILSDEMLAGLPFHHSYARVIAAQNIKSIFPDAKILITIREQNAIIYSSYGHYIRAGFTATFDDFLAQPVEDTARLFTPILNLDHFDYFQLLLFYNRLFSSENIMVAPMEWMLRNQDAFTDRLSDFLDTFITWSPDVAVEKVNPAWSEIALSAARQINKFYPQDARWRHKMGSKANSLAWWINRLTPNSVQKHAKTRSLNRIDAVVGDRYRQSNQDLSKRIDMDLGQLGYAI